MMMLECTYGIHFTYIMKVDELYLCRGEHLPWRWVGLVYCRLCILVISGGRGGTGAGTGSSEVVGTRINHHFSFEAVSMVVVVWPLLSRVPPEGFRDTSQVR